MYDLIRILEICKDPGTLKIIQFIKILINIVFTAVPIGTIIIGAIDIFKNITTDNDGNQKKNTAMFIKRLISCILLFLVPTIINLTFDILEEAKIEYAACWTNANTKSIKEQEIKNAETAMAKVESEQTTKNIQEAETAINQISDDAKRKEYQEKIDKIKEEISSKAIAERDAKEASANPKKNISSSGNGGSSGSGKVEIKNIDSITKESCPNAYRVYNRLITKHNLSKEVASGIVGNLFKESGGDGTDDLDPTSYSTEGCIKCGGIAGFTDNKSGAKGFSQLEEYAKSQGKEWTDIDVQTDIMMIKANEKWHWSDVNDIGSVTRLRNRGYRVVTVWETFLKLTNVEDAAISFLGVYEDCIYERTAAAYGYEMEKYVKYETSTRASLAVAVYNAFAK